jgi:hypothetical protein
VPVEPFPVTALPTAAAPRATAARTATLCSVRLILSVICSSFLVGGCADSTEETNAAWEAAQENL